MRWAIPCASRPIRANSSDDAPDGWYPVTPRRTRRVAEPVSARLDATQAPSPVWTLWSSTVTRSGASAAYQHGGIVQSERAGHDSYLDLDSLIPQQVGSRDPGARQRPHRQDARIAALARPHDLSVGELVVVAKERRAAFVDDHRQLAAAHRDGDVALHRSRSADRTVGLVGVCRDDQVPAEEVAQGSHVVDALVRLAVLPHVEAAVGESELERGTVDVVEPLLVVDLVQTERAKVGPERQHPRARSKAPRSRLRRYALPRRTE